LKYKTAEECMGHWFTGILGCTTQCGKNRGYANTALQASCKCYQEGKDLQKMLDLNGFSLTKKNESVKQEYDWPYGST
jgi:hypothetical protein